MVFASKILCFGAVMRPRVVMKIFYYYYHHHYHFEFALVVCVGVYVTLDTARRYEFIVLAA